MGPLTKKEERYAQFLYKERQLVVNALWWWERARVYQGTLISLCVPLRPFLTCLLTFIRPHYSFRLIYKLFNSLVPTMGTNEERARIKFSLSSHHFKVQQYRVLNIVQSYRNNTVTKYFYVMESIFINLFMVYVMTLSISHILSKDRIGSVYLLLLI
jgi:hypothetical protein